MKQVTVTIELHDDEAAWLDRWKAFSPVAPHPALTLEQKVAACVFHVWNIEAEREQRDELATEHRQTMN